MFSPRARGCSTTKPLEPWAQGVFPACAGMFPGSSTKPAKVLSFPRVRGDVPRVNRLTLENMQFSPRARGCSCGGVHDHGEAVVFPACAGMFLGAVIEDFLGDCFPRVRGDVPILIAVEVSSMLFSPRARGCSHVCHLHVTKGHVFPACAGMFLPLPPMLRKSASFPRVRGDVPTCTNVW